MRFEIVTAVEWEKVHDAPALFAAAAEAGIDRKEVESGMRQWLDGVWFARVEVTRRIPKAKATKAKATKAVPLVDNLPGLPGSEERILWYANFFASVPEAYDKGGRMNPPSPHD